MQLPSDISGLANSIQGSSVVDSILFILDRFAQSIFIIPEYRQDGVAEAGATEHGMTTLTKERMNERTRQLKLSLSTLIEAVNVLGCRGFMDVV